MNGLIKPSYSSSNLENLVKIGSVLSGKNKVISAKHSRRADLPAGLIVIKPPDIIELLSAVRNNIIIHYSL